MTRDEKRLIRSNILYLRKRISELNKAYKKLIQEFDTCADTFGELNLDDFSVRFDDTAIAISNLFTDKMAAINWDLWRRSK